MRAPAVAPGRTAEAGGLTGPTLAVVVSHLQVSGEPHYFRLSNVLPHGAVQRQVGDQPLQLAILILQLLEPPDLRAPMPTNCFFQR